MSNLADEMRKKTEKGKRQNQKFQEKFEKSERERKTLLNGVAAKEANELLGKALLEIEKSADDGKNSIEFLVGSCDSPSKETEEKLPMVAQHLSQFLVDKENNFDARPVVSISEEYVDSPRSIYVAVKISW